MGKCYYIPKLLATLKKAMTKLIAEKRKIIDLLTGETFVVNEN
jgi:hypothetical protein